MKTQYIPTSLRREERETLITCCFDENDNLFWEAESSIPAHITKLRKAGWEPTGEIVSSSNGSVQCVTFRTTAKTPISIRDLTRPKRQISDEERERRRQRLINAQNQSTDK